MSILDQLTDENIAALLKENDILCRENERLHKLLADYIEKYGILTPAMEHHWRHRQGGLNDDRPKT